MQKQPVTHQEAVIVLDTAVVNKNIINLTKFSLVVKVFLIERIASRTTIHVQVITSQCKEERWFAHGRALPMDKLILRAVVVRAVVVCAIQELIATVSLFAETRVSSRQTHTRMTPKNGRFAETTGRGQNNAGVTETQTLF